MDTGNGSKTVFADAVGKPVPKPSSASELASPINLLNPDRYEFYTFDDNGDLIKRLMSLEEIQGIIATGDSDGYDLDSFTSLGYLPEKKVNDVVNNVQSVLKEEMQTHKDSPVNLKPIFDTPDVSDSWSMILPAVFGNSGEDIKPEKPIVHVTPDTIMIEPNMQETYTSPSSIPLSSTIKPIKHTVASPTTPSTTKQEVSTNKPLSSPTPTVSTINTQTVSTPTLTPTKEAQIEPVVNVEIYSNSKSTETPLEQSGSNILEVVEIKPSDPQKTTIKPSTTKEPFTTPFEASESVKTENTTYIRTTYVSTSSPLPTPTLNTKQTIKTNTTYVPLTTVNTVTPPSTTTSMPLLTKATTEMPLSTWRPDPINTDITETANTRLEEIVLSTKEPEIGTYYIIVQKQTTKEVPPIPTLTEFLNSSQTEPAPTLPVDLQEVSTSTVNDNRDKNSILTESNTEASQTMLPDTYGEGDLNTLSSEHFGIKNDLAITQQYNQITTDLPLEQSLNTAQKDICLGSFRSTTFHYEYL
ncbi:hypothetical protein NQ317_007233 [Molorchus minor]|uniref:Uncharacterized protein n=1 Tax=Molorchus minor TaxID=1323400 RepID=A0ABQ9JX21_9CUCU|nr:hypothetical protein NQ317_007233 [Molorchus minor]